MTVSVRRAEEADLGHILVMGKLFHHKADLAKIASFDAWSFIESMEMMMKAPDTLVILAEIDGEVAGMAAAVSYRHWFNREHRGCQELFWYAQKPGCGPQMLAFMEAWAKQRALKEGSFTMVAREGLRPEALGRLYRRRGYSPQERSYTRRF